jgi:hypothetical protein
MCNGKDKWCECCDECCERYDTNIDNLFPESPFMIRLSPKRLNNIDRPFTYEKTIYLYDGRSLFYESIGDNDGEQTFKNKLIITQIDNNPITLRQIINDMMKSNHYNDLIVMSDLHYLLEYIEEESYTKYVALFNC